MAHIIAHFVSGIYFFLLLKRIVFVAGSLFLESCDFVLTNILIFFRLFCNSLM